MRVANRDAQRGKSGGYRVIYYVRTVGSVYLLEIYTKSEFEDVPESRVLAVIEQVRGEVEAQDGENLVDNGDSEPSE